jgi:hypothetical protein
MGASFKYVQPESTVTGWADSTLKLKYRDPAAKGPKGPAARPRTGNSHGPKKRMIQGNGVRKRAYGPF